MMMGLLMAINGARRQVVSFAAAGLILLGMMAVSAGLAIGNIARDGPISLVVDISAFPGLRLQGALGARAFSPRT